MSPVYNFYVRFFKFYFCSAVGLRLGILDDLNE